MVDRRLICAANPRRRAVRDAHVRVRTGVPAWLLPLLVALAFVGQSSRAHASPYGLRPPARALAPAPHPTLGSFNLTAPPPGSQPAPGDATAAAPSATTQPPPVEVTLEEPKLLKKKNVPPFWLDRTFDTHRTRALLLPPLFVHRTPTEDHPEKFFHANLALTFGWYAKANQKRRWINPAVLFFGSFSERKTVWGAVPLLMGYKRTGEQFNFGQFPLVWWWGNRHVKNFFVLPFHYQQKAPDSFTGVSALLFWYGRKNTGDADPTNDRKYFVGAPLFYRFQRGLSQFDFAFLYVGGRNKLKGTVHRTVFPFAHWQSREFGNRKELWTLAYIRRTDAARRKRAWSVPLTLTFGVHSPRRDLISATPLFWRHHNRLKDGTTTVVGPVGVYRDPRERNNVVFPLWWRFADLESGRKTSVLAPLAFARTSPERQAVWTLLGGGSRSKGGGWSMGIPPLLTFAGKTPEGRSHQGVLGLYWHVRDPKAAGGQGSDHLVAGPLFYRQRYGQDRSFGVPPLLTFVGKRGERSHQVITPMFWRFRDRAQQRSTLVVPPVYVRKDKDRWHGGVAPLAFFGGGSTRYAFVPWLLFGHNANDKRQVTVSPVYARWNDDKRRTLGAGLLFWDVKEKQAKERHSVFFPLYYRRQMGTKVSTFTPLGGAIRDENRRTWVATVAYGHRRGEDRDLGVVPLFFHKKRAVEGGVEANTVVPGLYIRHRDPVHDLDMYSPLVWRSNVRGDRPRKGLAVVPLYFGQRQPNGVDVDAGPLFYWGRNKTRSTHTLIAGPFYHRLSRKKLHTGIFPLYWWKDSEEKRHLFALPSIVHFANKAARSHTTIAVPLWFDRKQGNGRRTWVAFPFVVGNKQLHNFTRFSVIPPMYVDKLRIGRNSRFTGVLPFYFRSQKCGFQLADDPKCQYTVQGSVPFFLYGKDGMGRRTHGALLLYYFDKNPNGTTKFYTPIFGVNYKKADTLGWYALTLGVKFTKTHARHFFFPLYYHKKHRTQNESTTWVLPPLYVGQQQKDKGWFQSTLLVWQFRKQHKITTAIVPPVFFQSHAYAERRLHWFLPLYLRDNNMAKDKAVTFVFPGLYTQVRKGKNLDFVQFPLVWHIERGENQGTAGALLWWDIRIKGNTTQVVPALYTRRKTNKRTLNVVGPGLAWWWKGHGETEGDRGWNALLGIFGGGTKGGQRYMSLFGAKIPLGARSAEAKARVEARAARRKARAEARSLRRQARAAKRTKRQMAREAARDARARARRSL